jgi:hypothetical protein
LKIFAGDNFYKSLKRAFSPFWNFIDYIHYNIPRGIKNIFIWLPVVWKDRQWDFYYLFIMLHKKLSLMEPTIRNGHHVAGDRQANDIKTCRLLVKRIIDDNYHENAFMHHERKWGELELDWLPTDDSKYCQLKIERTNAKTEKEKEEERKASNRLYKHMEQMKDQDVKLLFKIMSKKGLSWWD